MIVLSFFVIVCLLQSNKALKLISIGGGKKPPIRLLEVKSSLLEAISKTGINGNAATSEQRAKIRELVRSLEKLNKVPQPSKSKLLESSSWVLRYTDFDPPGPSSGRLGLLTGEVYQYLDPQKGLIKNLLKIDLPAAASIYGGLVAQQSIVNQDTWRIEFDYVRNTIELLGGAFKIEGKRNYFDNEVRLWKTTYLDRDMRIIMARKEVDNKDPFIFVTTRISQIPLPVAEI